MSNSNPFMKLLFTLVSALLFSTVLLAQAPGQINYQGVARNSFGIVLPDQSISVRLNIHDGNAAGPTVYTETRTVKTNTFGMFTIGIGGAGATSSSGTLAAVNWANGGDKYLEVEMDQKGGSSFVKLGSAQLLSVPYSFYAASASPVGEAGGSLSGNYPNPGIAANAVGATQIKDSSISGTKLASGVLPTTLPPSGNAGGDLSGTYPNPTINLNAVTNGKIANGAVGTTKLADSSVTASKLASGTIPSTLPPSGNAGGDLSGTYPNPVVNTNAITNTKIADGAVSLTKLAAGVLPTTLPPSGNASGDLSGTYPAPTIATDAITTTKIADGSVTAAKLAAGAIPSTLPPSGNAGGDLSGTYPNPVLNADAVTTTKIADGAVSLTKLAAGVLPTTLPPSGNAGGDLSGTYPNPVINADAVTTTKIADGSVTGAKLAAGAIPATLPPSGNAGGDLSGTYPNPVLNADAVTTAKIADGAVSLTKLAAGVLPTSLPPNGAAGGDLSGTYPNPAVIKLQGNTISNTAPTLGQVLKYNGTAWAPGADDSGAFTLPYSFTGSNATNLFSVTNSGSATALEGVNSSATPKVIGILGKISATAAGDSSTGVRGMNSSTSLKSMGIWGSHNGGGKGVYGTSKSGEGVNGQANSGIGVYASSNSGTGLFATSTDGTAAQFDISNTANSSDALFVTNQGYGNGLTSVSTFGNGIFGVTNDADHAALVGINNSGGEAILGYTISDLGSGVTGRNDGKYAGVKGINLADNGVGILAVANSGGTANGNALVAELEGNQVGNTAVFIADGTNVARIDETGKGFFNGGTQVGGADVAEYFDIEGNINQYQPGDVLVISQQTDRTVEKSSAPYSNLISGVYATKPGLSLTEKNAEKNSLQNMVPMGVIGVLPTKVCMEGGRIKRGDFIVTSSLTGVAMKGDPEKVKVGQVLGKALQDFNSNGVGIINVLVSVK
jgi:hypothetical protein